MKNIPGYLIGTYLVIAPFLLLPGVGMYDSKRILQILLFGILSVCFLYTAYQGNSRPGKSYVSKNAAIWGGLLIGLVIISSIFSEFPRYAFIEIVLFGVIFFCIAQLSEQTPAGHYRLGKFVYGITITFSSVYLIYFFGNYIAAHLNPLVPMWPERLAVTIKFDDLTLRGEEVLHFANRRFFNHLQTWTLPLMVSMILYFKSKMIYRNLILVLPVCWWTLVFASGARGTLVSFVIACVVLFVLFRKRSYRFLGTAAGTAAGGFLLYFLMFKAFVPGKSLPIARMTDSLRLEKWGKAWELWLSSPLLGVGPMHYAAIGDPSYSASPHNLYLQILAEWGIAALLCFLALLILYLLFIKKKYLKNNFEFTGLSPRNSAVYMGFIGSAVAGFAHAGVSGIFHTPMSQIWAIIIMAWLISLWNRKSGAKKILALNRKHLSTFRGSSAPEEMSKKYGSGAPLEPSFKKGWILNRKYLSIIYLFLIAALFYLISPDIDELDRNHTQFRERFDTAHISPRFWEQGLIYEDMDTDMDSTSNGME